MGRGVEPMIEKDLSVSLDMYLETVNRHCSAEERKEIFRQMGQYLLEGTIDD